MGEKENDKNLNVRYLKQKQIK